MEEAGPRFSASPSLKAAPCKPGRPAQGHVYRSTLAWAQGSQEPRKLVGSSHWWVPWLGWLQGVICPGHLVPVGVAVPATWS